MLNVLRGKTLATKTPTALRIFGMVGPAPFQIIDNHRPVPKSIRRSFPQARVETRRNGLGSVSAGFAAAAPCVCLGIYAFALGYDLAFSAGQAGPSHPRSVLLGAVAGGEATSPAPALPLCRSPPHWDPALRPSQPAPPPTLPILPLAQIKSGASGGGPPPLR